MENVMVNLKKEKSKKAEIKKTENEENEKKILVTYISQTGNTKKIAEAIFESISKEKEIKPLQEIDDLENYSFPFNVK